MKKFPCALGNFVLACTGPELTLYHIHIFKEYFLLGAKSPDGTLTVLLNNHGAVRYITAAQDLTLSISLGLAVIMLLFFFAMIIIWIQKKI